MTATLSLTVTGAPAAAWQRLTDHRHYAYRGCAPDPDNPTRITGNPELSSGVFTAPDVDGGEPQLERTAREDAAIEVCIECPVMMLCHTYANTVDRDGHLAEPYGIFGGERALDRHKRLVAKRHQVVAAAPDARFDTPQKRAVLKALAAHTDPYAIADAADMDIRTANWQRSNLVTLLGLKRTATRNELLDAAAERGLLDGVPVTRDDGTTPATVTGIRIPATDKPPHAQPAPTPLADTATATDADVEEPRTPAHPVRIRSPRRTQFTAITGQLALWEAELEADLAAVHTLPTAPPVRLEAAA